MTDGILLRETLSDPLLMKYHIIIVDDSHERTLHSDIVLGLLKKIQRKRKHFKVIVTSATIQANLLKNFFETNTNCSSDSNNDTACIISMQGRPYHVDVMYLETPVVNYTHSCVDTALTIHQSEPLSDGDI